jgi:hypothetical protein
VMRGGQRQEGVVAARELINRWPGHVDSFSMPADEDPPDDHWESR